MFIFGTYVEPEPAGPDEDGAQENKGGVVGAFHGRFTIALALSKDDGIRERGASGGDMDWATSGKVNGWEII
jgi:hypothetical protein